MKSILFLFLFFSFVCSLDIYLNTFQGKDEDGCGSSAEPCKSLSYLFSKHNGTKEEISIYATGVDKSLANNGMDSKTFIPLRIIAREQFTIQNGSAYFVNQVFFEGVTLNLALQLEIESIFNNCSLIGGMFFSGKNATFFDSRIKDINLFFSNEFTRLEKVVTNNVKLNLGTNTEIINCVFNDHTIQSTSNNDPTTSTTRISNSYFNRVGMDIFNSGVKIEHSTFNISRINLEHGETYFNNCSFNNYINGQSSTLTITSRSLAQILSCNFKGNQGANGGALSLYVAEVLIRDCNFVGNVGTGRGGAIDVQTFNNEGANITLQNILVFNNSAMYGGGMSFAGANSEVNLHIIEPVNIISNEADYGGGIALLYVNINVSDVLRISKNQANYGGGAYLESSSLSNTVVSNNTAVNGTLFFKSGESLYNVTIIDNAAQVVGGIVAQSKLLLEKVVVENNSPNNNYIAGNDLCQSEVKNSLECGGLYTGKNLCITQDVNRSCKCKYPESPSFTSDLTCPQSSKNTGNSILYIIIPSVIGGIVVLAVLGFFIKWKLNQSKRYVQI